MKLKKILLHPPLIAQITSTYLILIDIMINSDELLWIVLIAQLIIVLTWVIPDIYKDYKKHKRLKNKSSKQNTI